MIWSCEIVNVEMKMAPHDRILCALYVHRAYVESVDFVSEVYCHVYIDLYSTDIW